MAGGTHPQNLDGAAARWQVLRGHVEDGQPLTRIAKDTGVSLRTVQRWHAAYPA